LQRVRQQLIPNLLEKSYENLRAGFDRFALFELNQVFRKDKGLTEENVPKTLQNIAFVLADKNSQTDFYHAKYFATKLGEKLGVKFEFREVKNLPSDEHYFEPKRSANIFLGDAHVGIIGEFRASVLRNMKLPSGTAGFEIGIDLLLKNLPKNAVNYQPIAKYPGTSRDITLQVAADKTFADVENLLNEILRKLPEGFVTKLTSVDIFAANEQEKNITFRIDFTDRKKTIDVEFVTKVMNGLAKEAGQKLDAKLI
jgi:phenylalanyl-tRNA synthetase beta chain